MFKFCVLLFFVFTLTFSAAKQQKTKNSTKSANSPKKQTIPLGTYKTIDLKKYQQPQQFKLQIGCKQSTIIDFQLSPALKRLHDNIFLNAQFQAQDCIRAKQDFSRILVHDQHWQLELYNVCCGKGNATRVFNQTLTVTVRDGFQFLGVNIKTKTWKIFMPVLTSLCICIFVWISNFSQPRASNVPLMSRFYKDTKNFGEQQKLITIDKQQQQ